MEQFQTLRLTSAGRDRAAMDRRPAEWKTPTLLQIRSGEKTHRCQIGLLLSDFCQGRIQTCTHVWGMRPETEKCSFLASCRPTTAGTYSLSP